MDIWNYAKERGWINPDEIPHVIIADIAYTDMAGDSGTRVIDCVTGMIAHEKYPHNGMAPHELMNPHEVTEMVKNCRVVIEKLSEKAG